MAKVYLGLGLLLPNTPLVTIHVHGVEGIESPMEPVAEVPEVELLLNMS